MKYFTGVLLALIATVIYVLLGGYRATAWNAVFQGLIGMAALWVTLFYMWTVAGGWKSVLAKAVAVSPKTFVAPGPIGIQTVAHHAALMVLIFWSVLWWPHIFIQLYTLREKELYKYAPIGLTASFLIVFQATALMAITALAFLGPGLPKKLADIVPVVLVKQHGPLWLLAFVMSTAHSQLMLVANVFRSDFVNKLRTTP
ncbi:MAG: sodium:solute symporter family transporter [Desulfotomaculales bacterium]